MGKGLYVCSNLPYMYVIGTADNCVFFCKIAEQLFLVMHFPEDGHFSGWNT